MERIAGIYRIVHVRSGRCYIGSTVNYAARVRAHRWHLDRGRHHSPKLQNDWDSDGADAFTFELFEEVVDVEFLADREQDHLDELRPWYNIARHAIKCMLGRPQSERFREAMRVCQYKRRRKSCARGHAMVEANVYVDAQGRRSCRCCRNDRSRRHREETAQRQGREVLAQTGVRTHCPKGHPYAGENLKVGKAGRYCRACHNADSRLRQYRTHCPQGHAYSDENTRYDSHGRRICLQCRGIGKADRQKATNE